MRRDTSSFVRVRHKRKSSRSVATDEVGVSLRSLLLRLVHGFVSDALGSSERFLLLSINPSRRAGGREASPLTPCFNFCSHAWSRWTRSNCCKRMATKSASFSTLCRIDLPLNGDIAEFCPCAGYERSLAVGTDELIEVPAARLATISQPTPMRRSLPLTPPNTTSRAGRRSSYR